MSTLTVCEAAQRLGIKPRKVRRYISEHKLSARAAPLEPGKGRRTQLLLDTVEVETLAQIRAYNRGQRAVRQRRAAVPGCPVDVAPVAADSDTAVDRGQVSVATEMPGAPLTPVVGEVDVAIVEWHDGATGSPDASGGGPGEPVVALVRAMLAPLIEELHDARETIRHQAEEIGALRTVVADLERQVAAVALAPPASPLPAVAAAGPTARLDRVVGLSAPLWRRALVYVVAGVRRSGGD